MKPVTQARTINSYLALTLALLLGLFFSRAHQLLTLPGFVDEGNHLLWAADVWLGRVIFPFSTAKPLEMFYLAAFLPFENALWLGRMASLLAALVTMSCIGSLGGQAGGAAGGLAGMALYALMPWTFFHERLAVADPLTAACALLLTWLSLRWAKMPTPWRTAALNAAMICVPLAKYSAITLLVLPLLAAALGRRRNFPAKKLALVYLVSVGVVGLSMIVASVRYDALGEVTGRVNDGSVARWLDFLQTNIGDLIEWAQTYAMWNSLVIGLGMALALSRPTAVGWLALAGAALAGATLLFSPSTTFPRYYLPAWAFGSVLGGIGFSHIARWLKTLRLRLAWTTLVFAPTLAAYSAFAATAYLDPARLPLVDVDRSQHVTTWSSGYAVREATRFVAQQAAMQAQPAYVYAADLSTQVIGLLYWPRPAHGDLFVLWGESAPGVIEAVAANKPVYLIVDTTRDEADFGGLPITVLELARFDRPGGGLSVVVYRLSPAP